MRCTLLIFFFIVTLRSVYAQCEIHRTENESRFEEWLRLNATSMNARTEQQIYRIPVVVHILHQGNLPGEGLNFPTERIVAQIKTLNDDFRRKEGTPGFNDNSVSDDSRIEFMLAQIDPNGNPTDGVDRVDITKIELPPGQRDIIELCAAYSYWDPERYLNIWSLGGNEPIPLLGSAQFPMSDLEGLPNTEHASDGIWVEAYAFGHGEMNNHPDFDMGRTLTHEMGHFLGLLHTWGSVGNSRQCDTYSDYCDDTPPTPVATNQCDLPLQIACDGRPVMVENYMGGSYDRCLNIFTKDQITRMHTVLNNSPRRKSLITSPVIDRSGVVTGIDDDYFVFQVYPNPATDKLYIARGKNAVGNDIQITMYSLSGQVLFKRWFTSEAIEISLSEIHENLVIVTIESPQAFSRQIISIF